MNFFLLEFYPTADIDRNPDKWAKHSGMKCFIEDAAFALGVSRTTLRNWEKRGVGPKPIYVEGRKQYRLGDLHDFVRRRYEELPIPKRPPLPLSEECR